MTLIENIYADRQLLAPLIAAVIATIGLFIVPLPSSYEAPFTRGLFLRMRKFPLRQGFSWRRTCQLFSDFFAPPQITMIFVA